MTLGGLVEALRGLRGVRHKLDIRDVSGKFGRSAFGGCRAVRNGDDCAAIPDGEGGGHTLFAIEGLVNEFVEAEPWFAGYCAVMVNASDIYSMGGRPVAVVDAIWSRDGEKAQAICAGMVEAAEKYGIPIVGGHTNTRSAGEYVAAAILGRGGPRLLTSFDAVPGDMLVAAIDLRGEWFGRYPYWNCSTGAPAERLRGDLEVLPGLAEDGLCRAAKDISMGGIVGTTAMLAECSAVGATVEVEAVPRPAGADLVRWLSSFPSYGFILSVEGGAVEEVLARFRGRGVAAAVVGRIDRSLSVSLAIGGERAVFWDFSVEPFIGFGPTRGER